MNRSVKANAGTVTQRIHPSLKQRTLIHIQTHTYRQSYVNSVSGKNVVNSYLEAVDHPFLKARLLPILST